MQRMRIFQARSLEEVGELLKSYGNQFVYSRTISGFEVIAGFSEHYTDIENSYYPGTVKRTLSGITAIVKNRGGWPVS